MPRDTTVIAFRQPEAIDDPLTEVAREGARRMLAQVLIAEADSLGGVSRRVSSLPEPPERSDTPCREIPLSSHSVSLRPSTIL